MPTKCDVCCDCVDHVLRNATGAGAHHGPQACRTVSSVMQDSVHVGEHSQGERYIMSIKAEAEVHAVHAEAAAHQELLRPGTAWEGDEKKIFVKLSAVQP